jgi:hypothetical protein
MKIAVFIFYSLISFCYLSAQDQSSSVYRFKAFEVISRSDNDNSEISESDWEPRDIVVVINFDKSKVQTYGKRPVDIDLIKQTNSFTNDDGNYVFKYSGVDKDGSKVYVTLVIFKDNTKLHIATLVLDYYESKIAISFRLKRDD